VTDSDLSGGSVRKGLAILVLAVVIAGFTVFLATGLIGRSSATGRSGEELVGKAPPWFAAPKIDGGIVTLDQYQGSPLIINFWASWCPPCRDETPDIEDMWKSRMDEGLVVIGVNVQDSEEEAKNYLSEFSVTFPNVLDSDGRITVEYGVTGLPVTFFISRDGRVAGRWVGSISESRLASWATFLLEGNLSPSASSGNNAGGYRSLN